MKRKPKSYSREKRKTQMIDQCKIWIEKNEPVLFTSYRMANALEMTPSWHVISMLNELVDDGFLTVSPGSQSGRWATNFYYPVVSRLITEKYGKRRIVVKHKGVVSGQLEMGI